MTEDEAKTKWCPFSRATASDTEWHSNRPSFADTDKSPFDTCLVSDCMAWRQQDAHIHVLQKRSWDSPGAGWSKIADHTFDALPLWECKADVPATGYCGFAGAPQ